MSLTPVPSNAQLHYAPEDHSWYSVDQTIPLFARGVQNVGQFQIPPNNNIQITNDASGNPLFIYYYMNSTLVATISCAYDVNNFFSGATQY